MTEPTTGSGQRSRVWLLITGCYENRGVAGVYTSAEAAMAAHPEGAWSHDRARGWAMKDYYDPEGAHAPEGGYVADDSYDIPDHWRNDLDWDDAAVVEPWEVQGE